jgi:hypothetical protein
MSFFGGLTSSNIEMPDAIFDQSSMLPPLNTAGYGPGYDGTPDGRINQASSLFSNMEPYAYGKGDRLSTQTAYLANPHNIQKIVPQLRLPDCIRSDEHSHFTLPHSVTDGDVAFSIRFASGNVRTELMNNPATFFKQGAGRAVDYVCNISTINYIIRGLFTEEKFLNPAWRHFAAALGFDKEYAIIQESYRMMRSINTDKSVGFTGQHKTLFHKSLRSRAETLVRDHFRPLGVVIGSEKQGGQHEVGQKTVTWPVAYIVTISIDGRNENLCNYWRHLDVSAGRDLGFFVQMKKRSTFGLNYTKQVTRKHFSDCSKDANETPIMSEFPQLCPGTTDVLDDEHHEIFGHWHFCMSHAMHHKATNIQMYNDVTTLHVGALLLSTVSVVWVRNHRIDKAIMLNGATKDEKETVFKSFPSFHANKGIAMGHGPANFFQGAHYLTAANNPLTRALQGKVAVTLSTHTEQLPARAPVVRPRPCSDEELKAMGAPVRTKPRLAVPEVVKVAAPVITAAAAPAHTLGSSSPYVVSKATTTKARKKNATEGGSVL